jgi:hypothetical protein
LELGARSQEPGEKRKKEEGRSQKKCFYKYEMLPILLHLLKQISKVNLKKMWAIFMD